MTKEIKGFGHKTVDAAYKKLSQFMVDNTTELNDEAQS